MKHAFRDEFAECERKSDQVWSWTVRPVVTITGSRGAIPVTPRAEVNVGSSIERIPSRRGPPSMISSRGTLWRRKSVLGHWSPQRSSDPEIADAATLTQARISPLNIVRHRRTRAATHRERRGTTTLCVHPGLRNGRSLFRLSLLIASFMANASMPRNDSRYKKPGAANGATSADAGSTYIPADPITCTDSVAGGRRGPMAKDASTSSLVCARPRRRRRRGPKRLPVRIPR